MASFYCGFAMLLICAFIGWRIRHGYYLKLSEILDYCAFLDYAKRNIMAKKAVETTVFEQFKGNKYSLVGAIYKALDEDNITHIECAKNTVVADCALPFWRELRAVDFAFLEEKFSSHCGEMLKAVEIARSEYSKYGGLASKLGVLAGCFVLILLL